MGAAVPCDRDRRGERSGLALQLYRPNSSYYHLLYVVPVNHRWATADDRNRYLPLDSRSCLGIRTPAGRALRRAELMASPNLMRPPPRVLLACAGIVLCFVISFFREGHILRPVSVHRRHEQHWLHLHHHRRHHHNKTVVARRRRAGPRIAGARAPLWPSALLVRNSTTFVLQMATACRC